MLYQLRESQVNVRSTRMVKLRILIPASFALAFFLNGCSIFESILPPADRKLQPLTVCTSAKSPLQAPVWYAFENGLFTAYDLEVELVEFPNGSLAATSMVAGEADVCQLASSNVVNVVIAGEDVRLIGGLYDRHVYSLMVRPEITDAAGLAGKSIAVTRPGTATDTSLRVALGHLGLTADEDVAVISAGSLGDILAALVSGSVDGGIIGVPLAIEAREAGFNELLDISSLPYPYQHLAIAASEELLDQRPEAARNVMRAISQAIYLMKDDQEGTVGVLAKYLDLDPSADASLLDQSYEIAIKRQLQAEPFVSEEGVQALIDLNAESNPNAADVSVDDVVDFSIMEDLEQSGFLAGLKE